MYYVIYKFHWVTIGWTCLEICINSSFRGLPVSDLTCHCSYDKEKLNNLQPCGFSKTHQIIDVAGQTTTYILKDRHIQKDTDPEILLPAAEAARINTMIGTLKW